MNKGVGKFVQIEIVPMRFVHMVGWTNTIIPDAQFCAFIGRQFNSYAWFGCIELHKQKPLAEYSPRDPSLRK